MLAFGAVVALLIVFMCAGLGKATLPVALGMNISRPFGGNELLFKLSITNNSSLPIRLNGLAQVIYEDETGNGMATDFFRLAGSGTNIVFRPGDTDSVLLRASGGVRRVRIAFDYTYPADPLRKAVGRTLAKIGFRPAIRGACWHWMNRNGLLGGRFLRSYDRTWVVPNSSYIAV